MFERATNAATSLRTICQLQMADDAYPATGNEGLNFVADAETGMSSVASCLLL